MMKHGTVAPYSENTRPDGTGGGFLVWFRPQGREWASLDTEVVRAVSSQQKGDGPTLAP